MSIFYSREDTTNNEILPQLTIQNLILDNYDIVKTNNLRSLNLVSTSAKTNYLNFTFDVSSTLTNLDSIIKDYEYLEYIKFLIIPTTTPEEQKLIETIKLQSLSRLLISNLTKSSLRTLTLTASEYCDAEITKRILNTNNEQALNDNNFNFTLHNSFEDLQILNNYLTLNVFVYFDVFSFCVDNKIQSQINFVNQYFGDQQHHIFYILTNTQPQTTQIIEGVLSDYRVIKSMALPTLSIGSKTSFIEEDNTEKNFSYLEGLYQSNSYKGKVYNYVIFDYDLFIKTNTIVDDVQQGLEGSQLTIKVSRKTIDTKDNYSIQEMETATLFDKRIVQTVNNSMLAYPLENKVLLCLIDDSTPQQVNNTKYQYIFEIIYKDKLIFKLYNSVNQTGLFFDATKIINKFEVLTNFALQKIDSGKGSYVNKYGKYTEEFFNTSQFDSLRPTNKEIEYLFTIANYFIKDKNEKFTNINFYVESLDFRKATLDLHLIFLKNIKTIFGDIEKLLSNQSLSIFTYLKEFNAEFEKNDMYYSLSNKIKDLPLISKDLITSYFTLNTIAGTESIVYATPTYLNSNSTEYSFDNFIIDNYTQEIVYACVSLLNKLLAENYTNSFNLETLLEFYSCVVTKNAPNITTLLQPNKRQIPLTQGNSSFKKETNTIQPLAVKVSDLANKPLLDNLSPLSLPSTVNNITDSNKLLFDLLFGELTNEFQLNKNLLSPAISLYYYENNNWILINNETINDLTTNVFVKAVVTDNKKDLFTITNTIPPISYAFFIMTV